VSPSKSSRVATTLERVLSADELNALGVELGQSLRLRVVTPHRLVLCLLDAFSDGGAETIADLCRTFNYQNRTNTAYKAFYNRLARPEFPRFMKAVVRRLTGRLARRVLEPVGDRAVSRFDDIVIQDGSSFALKPALQSSFPGRFKNREPSAVEIHATFSGFRDEVTALEVTPDTTQERAFLPPAQDIARKLLLADRGYPSRDYFTEIDEAGGHFVIRLTRSYKPWVLAVHGGHPGLDQPERLQELVARCPGQVLDLDIEFRQGKRRRPFRLVVVPGRDTVGAWLCTNLPRPEFPAELVGRLYKFRWQIELLFKEWKSYANLRKFGTANPHIAEGLIWASLAAALLKRYLAHATQLISGVPISTRKVAMCAGLVLRSALLALGQPLRLRRIVRDAIAFLATNARRANPRRDRLRGRECCGLRLRLAA
jgi:hypothetical protein